MTGPFPPPRVSAAAMQAMYEQNTSEIPLVLLTFDNPDDPGAEGFPIRLVGNSEPIVSRGETYAAALFQIELPQEEVGVEPSLKLIIPGPPEDFIAVIRQIVSPPTFLLEIIISSDPDTVVRKWDQIVMRKVEADQAMVSFELRYETLSQEAFPGDRFSLPNFPALF